MSNEDMAAVRHAVERFHAALNAIFTGDVGPMTEVWSHADDVTYMGPRGGFQTGWDQVLTEWRAQAAMNLGGDVQPSEMKITLGLDLAATYSLEIGHNEDAPGDDQTVKIRATSVFRKETGSWKMVAHHTDLLPCLTE